MRFRRGDGKEQIARPYQLAAAAEDRTGVVLVGKAQERMDVWRGWVDKDLAAVVQESPTFLFRTPVGGAGPLVFLCVGRRLGPGVHQAQPVCPLRPVGHGQRPRVGQRRLARAGVGFIELGNGLWTVEDPAAARRICASLGSGHLRGLIGRWPPALPTPLTVADAGPGSTGPGRCASWRSPTPLCSTGRQRVERGSRPPFAYCVVWGRNSLRKSPRNAGNHPADAERPPVLCRLGRAVPARAAADRAGCPSVARASVGPPPD